MSLDLLGQIAEKTIAIQALENQLPGQISAEQAWRAQSLEPCEFRFKNKQNACLADKVFKKGRADTIKQNIANIRAQISRLTADKVSLNDTLVASNVSMKELASQGESLEALMIEAQGTAAAAQTVAEGSATAAQTEAEITAKAEAVATIAQGKADAEATKQTMLIASIVGAVILLAIIGFVALKLKNLKKKSK